MLENSPDMCHFDTPHNIHMEVGIPYCMEYFIVLFWSWPNQFINVGIGEGLVRGPQIFLVCGNDILFKLRKVYSLLSVHYYAISNVVYLRGWTEQQRLYQQSLWVFNIKILCENPSYLPWLAGGSYYFICFNVFIHVCMLNLSRQHKCEIFMCLIKTR